MEGERKGFADGGIQGYRAAADGLNDLNVALSTVWANIKVCMRGEFGGGTASRCTLACILTARSEAGSDCLTVDYLRTRDKLMRLLCIAAGMWGGEGVEIVDEMCEY